MILTSPARFRLHPLAVAVLMFSALPMSVHAQSAASTVENNSTDNARSKQNTAATKLSAVQVEAKRPNEGYNPAVSTVGGQNLNTHSRHSSIGGRRGPAGNESARRHFTAASLTLCPRHHLPSRRRRNHWRQHQFARLLGADRYLSGRFPRPWAVLPRCLLAGVRRSPAKAVVHSCSAAAPPGASSIRPAKCHR